MQKRNDTGTQTGLSPQGMDTATGPLGPPPAATGGNPFKPGWLSRHPAGITFGGGGTHAVRATVAQAGVIPPSALPGPVVGIDERRGWFNGRCVFSGLVGYGSHAR